MTRRSGICGISLSNIPETWDSLEKFPRFSGLLTGKKSKNPVSTINNF